MTNFTNLCILSATVTDVKYSAESKTTLENIHLVLNVKELDENVSCDITKILQANPNWKNITQDKQKALDTWKGKETGVLLINNTGDKKETLLLPTFENLMALGANLIPYIKGDFDEYSIAKNRLLEKIANSAGVFIDLF